MKFFARLFLLLLTVSGYQTTFAQWTTVGNAGFSSGFAYWNGIAFDSQKNLYVAYSDQNYNQQISVKKLVGGVWTILGSPGFAGGQGGQACSMAIGTDDIPYVATISRIDLQASVWKLVGAAWEKVGSDVSEEMAGSVEIAINSLNEPYLFYRDQKSINGIAGRGTVKKFNGTAWELVGAAGFSDDFIQSMDLAIDGNDVPYVAYEDGGSALKASVKKFNGSGWVSVGPTGLTPDWAKYISLAINSNNVPYLAFRDSGAGAKANCMKFNGISWELVGTSGISPSIATFVSLAIDKDDVPFIAYKQEDSPFSVSVKNFNGTTWNLVGAANFSGNTVGFISLTMDSFGNPYVAYQDGNNGFRETVSAFIINDPLPVRLASFEGKFSKTEQAIVLDWSTSQEISNDRFEIQSGSFPNTLKTIAEVKGKGYSYDNAFYSFTDRTSTGSIVYYRLKQIDYDGTFSYSKIISVHKPDTEGLYIAGNPVRDNMLRIRTGGKSSESVYVKVFSAGGKALGQWKFTQEEHLEIDIKDLGSGMYILQYEDIHGVQSRKFVRD